MRCDGPESRFFRRLPELLLAGVVPAAAIAALAGDATTAILAAASMLAWAMALLPVAIAFLIVSAMKGRPRTADSYPLPEPDSVRRG